MKNRYLRTVVFVVLKSSVYSLMLLATGWIVGEKISEIAYSIIFCALYAILTFVFSEWMFIGRSMSLFHLIGILTLGYALDFFVSVSFFSWYYDRNLFLEQTVGSQWIFVLIFLVSTVGAYILKKRSSAMRSVSEGLA